MARVCVTCGRRVAGDLPVCLACGSDVGAQVVVRPAALVLQPPPPPPPLPAPAVVLGPPSATASVVRAAAVLGQGALALEYGASAAFALVRVLADGSLGSGDDMASSTAAGAFTALIIQVFLCAVFVRRTARVARSFEADAFASLLPLNLVVTGLNLAVLVVLRFDPARLPDLAVYVTATLAAIGASRLLADA